MPREGDSKCEIAHPPFRRSSPTALTVCETPCKFAARTNIRGATRDRPFAVSLVTHDCFARTHRCPELRRRSPDPQLYRRSRTDLARERTAILRVRSAE